MSPAIVNDMNDKTKELIDTLSDQGVFFVAFLGPLDKNEGIYFTEKM